MFGRKDFIKPKPLSKREIRQIQKERAIELEKQQKEWESQPAPPFTDGNISAREVNREDVLNDEECMTVLYEFRKIYLLAYLYNLRYPPSYSEVEDSPMKEIDDLLFGSGVICNSNSGRKFASLFEESRWSSRSHIPFQTVRDITGFEYRPFCQWCKNYDENDPIYRFGSVSNYTPPPLYTILNWKDETGWDIDGNKTGDTFKKETLKYYEEVIIPELKRMGLWDTVYDGVYQNCPDYVLGDYVNSSVKVLNPEKRHFGTIDCINPQVLLDYLNNVSKHFMKGKIPLLTDYHESEHRKDFGDEQANSKITINHGYSIPSIMSTIMEITNYARVGEVIELNLTDNLYSKLVSVEAVLVDNISKEFPIEGARDYIIKIWSPKKYEQVDGSVNSKNNTKYLQAKEDPNNYKTVVIHASTYLEDVECLARELFMRDTNIAERPYLKVVETKGYKEEMDRLCAEYQLSSDASMTQTHQMIEQIVKKIGDKSQPVVAYHYFDSENNRQGISIGLGNEPGYDGKGYERINQVGVNNIQSLITFDAKEDGKIELRINMDKVKELGCVLNLTQMDEPMKAVALEDPKLTKLIDDYLSEKFL